MFKFLSFGKGTAPADPHPGAAPLRPDAPCGDSLEMDADYAVLEGRLRPRAEVQYGNFVHADAGPDWPEIERETQRLLGRSRDIHLLVWFTRARTRSAGQAGLLEGLLWLKALLQTWPEHLHPQLMIDGEHDPAVRANALAALTDPEGLLADIRQLQLASGSGLRLSVRDVERALAKTRVADALDPDAVRRQLRHLHDMNEPALLGLLASAEAVRELQALARENLGENAPDLGPLQRLLDGLKPSDKPSALVTPLTLSVVTPGPARSAPLPSAAPVLNPAMPIEAASSPSASRIEQREQVRQRIAEARQWIEEHEPSSPVAILLKQAERLWGRRFAEVAGAIPADLLAQWDRE